jgi:hypothetical protein
MIGSTFQEHLLNLLKVFQRFQETSPKLSPQKYGTSGITCHPKPRVVWEWQTPKNQHEIRSSLGLFTHYRYFICSFANNAKPLTKLTEEKQAFLWTPEVRLPSKCLSRSSVLPLFLLTHSQERGSLLTQM